MKQVLPLLSLFAALAIVSCKSNGDDTNPTPSGLLSGYLTVSRQLDLDSPATKYTESAFAAFFMHPYQQASDTLHITVDSVRINGVNAMLDNAPKIYRASGAFQANASCNWQVWSSTNISTFAYNFSTPYPSYTYTLPDTLDRASGLTISLPIGSDSATITLGGSQLVQGNYKGTTGSIAASDLSGFSAGNAVLEVSGYKMTTQAFGGKNFRFTKRTIKTKNVWLK